MADGTEKTGTVESTLGRFIFNEILPQDLGFVDRSIPENALVLEVDFHVGKKGLKQILEKVINIHGATTTAEVLDDIKAMGYKYSTRAAMKMCIRDRTVAVLVVSVILGAIIAVLDLGIQYGIDFLVNL